MKQTRHLMKSPFVGATDWTLTRPRSALAALKDEQDDERTDMAGPDDSNRRLCAVIGFYVLPGRIGT
jgi:hypothetical protein